MNKLFYSSQKIRTLVLCSLFLFLLTGGAQYCEAIPPPAVHAVKSGNWSDNTVWSTGTVPTSVSTVTIGSSYTVTVDLAGEKCTTLNLGDVTNSGSLVFNSNATLTVSSTITIGTSTTPGNIDMTNGGILSVARFSIPNPGTWIPGAGSVILTGTAQTLPTTFVTSFNDLTIYLSSGVLKLSLNLNVANSLNIALGGLDLAGFSLTAGDLQGIKQLTNSGANQIVTVGGDGNSTVFSGIIQNGAGTITLIKTGTGTLTLLGANTYSGGTSLNEGEIDIDNATALGTGALKISAGTTIDNTNGSSITLSNNNAQMWNGNFTFRGSNDLNLGTGAVTLGASPSVSILGGTLTVGGTINDFANSLTTVGGGTFSLGSQAVQLNALNLGAGTFISTSGNLNLVGDYSDSGTFINNGGTVTFNGTAGQTISAIAIPETFNNISFNDLSGITLASPISVSGILSLANGIINANDTTDILTLNSTATCPASGSATSYVNGPVAKIGNSAFVFPVGGSGRFMPLGISAPATVTDTITARYKFTPPINPFYVNQPLTTVSTLEYWILSESVPTDEVTISLHWLNSPISGIYTYDTTLRVAKYSGGTWHDLGQSAIIGAFPGAGSVTARTGITSFNNSFITFGSTNPGNNPLPITLTSFNATYIAENNSVLLNWEVASQLNNKEFVIEKTTDGINYTAVAKLAGAGTTPFSNSYSAVDNNPYEGVSYYRLKQIDEDGNSTEFSPVAVHDGVVSTTSITVYPNPVMESANISYISEDSQPITVSIYDLSGRVVISTQFTQVVAGANNFSLNTSGLSSGIYLLQIANPQKSFYQKILKQ